MKFKKKQINSLVLYFFTLFYVISLLFMIGTSNNKDLVVVSNIHTVKAVESSRVAMINEKITNNNQEEFIKVFSTEEIKLNQGKKLEFVGTLTGYGPDCVGCSGIVACEPHQNVKNGNIYYQDSYYGKIRILAADRSIPCGSIIKISNYFDSDFYGIVLDRGSAIVGLTMDLLYESEKNPNLGRAYNINFQIERWGY